MDIKDNFYYGILFAYYKNLLTPKQCTYLSMYYDQNYSIIEIAQSFAVSKESVFDLIKRVNLKLVNYEEKLKLHAKANLIEQELQQNNVDKNVINKIMTIW